MKTNKLNSILSSVAVAAIAALFLFLIAPAVSLDASSCRGYDLMFGNDAISALVSPIGAFIAVFVVTIVAAVFSAVGAIFYGIDKQEQSHKFCAFLLVIAGLGMAASAVAFFLSPMFFAEYCYTTSLAWGAIASGACSAVAAVAALVAGVKGFLVK